MNSLSLRILGSRRDLSEWPEVASVATSGIQLPPLMHPEGRASESGQEPRIPREVVPA